MERYKRQMCLEGIGKVGQRKLTKARVLVVGCGGLGSTVLPLLSGAGIGFLRLCDHDRIEESNLHRQILYRMEDIGKNKVDCAKISLAKQNPFCHIDSCLTKLTPKTVHSVLENMDLVIDAADNYMVTYTLSDVCKRLSIPLIAASVIGYKGYVGGFCGKAPSYRALFPKIVPGDGNCNTVGVMGPIVSLMGSIQAQMALNVILDFPISPLGQFISVDGLTWRLNQFCFDEEKEPKEPTIRFIDPQDINKNDFVVELRSKEEAPKTVTEHAIRLLPQEVEHYSFPFSSRIVFVCKSGIRSAQACYRLQAKGYNNFAIIADS